MEGHDFDRLVRTVASGATRRTILGGLTALLLAGAGAAPGGPAVLAKGKKKKKCKRGARKCDGRCIPASSCCTTAECQPNQSCVDGQCVCKPDCAGKECGDDGCGGSCGGCSSGQCIDGTCGCDASSALCAAGRCCAQGDACVGGTCGACPETPDACAVEVICGRTTAASPLCYCVTSLDDVTTCTSVFVNPNQAASCQRDTDCAGLLGPGVEMVCVDAPCLNLPGRPKVCMNKGCEDLNARSRTRSGRDAFPMIQLDLHPRA
jgi:hypothetical protein